VQKKVLLLIDGGGILMDITKKILERAGFDVVCAAGLAEAKKQLHERAPPDGIVLENELPDGNGLDCCGELRRESSIPIMFLSSDREDELPSLRAGANDFLKKPFDYDVMKARLEVMLGIKSAPGQNEKKAEKSKKKKKIDIGGLYVAAVCLILLLGRMAVSNTANDISEKTIPDESIPLGSLSMFPAPDENAKPYAESEMGILKNPEYLIPHYGDAVFSAETGKTETVLINPKGNPCGFIFEIILEETQENLYISGLVEPGMCIEGAALSKPLAAGEYKALLIIRIYEPETYAEIAEERLKFTITVV
jgi:CheY-like chemotaxis protein